MDVISTVIKHSKKIETLLGNKLGAQGKGLHEKASSVEARLPKAELKRIRAIASIRNATVHEDGYEPDDIDRFVAEAERVTQYLEGLPTRAKHGNAASIQSLKAHPNLGKVNQARKKPAPKKSDSDESSNSSGMASLIGGGVFAFAYWHWMNNTFDFVILAYVFAFCFFVISFTIFDDLPVADGVVLNLILLAIYVFGYQWIGGWAILIGIVMGGAMVSATQPSSAESG